MKQSKQKPRVASPTISQECDLRLDYCNPEYHYIPPGDEESVQQPLTIYGNFANSPRPKVTFFFKNDKGHFEEDKQFTAEGDATIVQFNEILLLVRINGEAQPGLKYITVTQGDGCAVNMADLNFKLI